MMYRLIVLNGPTAGQRWTIPPTGAVIGRGTDCAIRIPDEEAAARHAAVEFAGDEPRIRDLGSMNRILVNQREVRESPLKHGDTIEIGLTRLLVEAHVQAEVAAPRVPASGRRRSRAMLALALAAALAALLVGLESQRGRRRAAAARPPETAAARPAPEPAPPEAPPASEPPVPVEPAALAESAPTAPAAISEEVRRLREDVASLRDAVVGLSPARDGPPPADDPADRMLAQARAEIAAGRLAEAEKLLEGLLVLAPDRAEAIAERAALDERRGRFKRAFEHWRRLAEGEYPEAARRQAAEAMRRLRALEAERAAAGPGVRLADLQLVKFIAPEGVAELRTVHARIERAPECPPPDPDDIELEVVFYERDSETGAVRPSAAVPPQTARLEGPWTDPEPRSLIAPYRVPLEARQGAGAPLQFHGYVARLRVLGRTVAWRARPLDLAEVAQKDESR